MMAKAIGPQNTVGAIRDEAEHGRDQSGMKLSTVEIAVSMIGWKRWRLRRSHPTPRARARVRPLHADFVLFDAAIRILLGVPFRSQPTKTYWS